MKFVPVNPPAAVKEAFEPRFNPLPVAVAVAVNDPLVPPSQMRLLIAGFDVYPGAPLEPVALPRTLYAAAFEREKLSAGVEVDVATLVVKSGERFPELKLVTVPLFAAEIVPLLMVIVVPSGFTQPTAPVVAFEQEIVPDVVTGPPVKPAPVATLVTVPDPPRPQWQRLPVGHPSSWLHGWHPLRPLRLDSLCR